jgi:hypothetical protein
MIADTTTFLLLQSPKTTVASRDCTKGARGPACSSFGLSAAVLLPRLHRSYPFLPLFNRLNPLTAGRVTSSDRSTKRARRRSPARPTTGSAQPTSLATASHRSDRSSYKAEHAHLRPFPPRRTCGLARHAFGQHSSGFGRAQGGDPRPPTETGQS